MTRLAGLLVLSLSLVVCPSLARAQAASDPAPPLISQYLAEGATGSFFDTRLAFFNPSEQTTATVALTFQTDTGANVPVSFTLAPHARSTLDVKSVPGLASASFSTRIDSNVRVVVDRTMSWDHSGYGSSAETALAAPSTTWYFAEGSTSGAFSLFYLLQNPNDATVSATVRYLRPFGIAPIEKIYILPPRSRTTIPVDTEAPELANTDVGAVVTATAPIVAERSMYYSTPTQVFAAGHESAGVTQPAVRWFLAEGATGPFFDLFILLGNPSATTADVRVDYLLSTGDTLSKSYTVPANGRFTIPVDTEEIPAGSGQHPLTNVAVSSIITSTNNVPIVVERTMWWPSPELGPNYWTEAHNAAGTTQTATRWALAEGEVGGGQSAETYILIANTSTVAGQARVTLFAEDGSSQARVYDLRPSSRTTVRASADFSQMVGKRFGALIESLGDTPAQLVVERSMYTSPGGVTWAAGTDAVGALLPTIETLDQTSGTSGTLVTLRGAGFTPQTRVTFGGVAAATTYIAPDQLRVLVPFASSNGTFTPLPPSVLDVRVDDHAGGTFTIQALPANPYPAGAVWQAFTAAVSANWPTIRGQMAQTWAAVHTQSTDPKAIAFAQAMLDLNGQLQTFPDVLTQLQGTLSPAAMALLEQSLVAQGYTPTTLSVVTASARVAQGVAADNAFEFLESRGKAPALATTLKYLGLIVKGIGLATTLGGPTVVATPVLEAAGVIISVAGALTDAYIAAAYGTVEKLQISDGTNEEEKELTTTLPVQLSASIEVQRSINLGAAIELANITTDLEVLKDAIAVDNPLRTWIDRYLDLKSKLPWLGISIPGIPNIPLGPPDEPRPLDFSFLEKIWPDRFSVIDPLVILDANGHATRSSTKRARPSDTVWLRMGPADLLTTEEHGLIVIVNFTVPTPDSIVITPTTLYQRLYMNDTVIATAYDANKQPFFVDVTWGTLDPSIISVGQDGTVHAKSRGVARLYATDVASGKTGTASVVVSGDAHFWTTTQEELTKFLNQDGGTDWAYEGQAFFLLTYNPGDAVLLWRFYDATSGTHFWTTDPNGELFPNIGSGVVREGTVGWVYTSPGPNRVAIRRWYNPYSDEHFWTVGNNEIPDPIYGFIDEGFVFYTPPANAQNIVPMHRVRCIQCYGF